MRKTTVAFAWFAVCWMPSSAQAGPACPDLVGSWTFSLSCVAVPRVPAFDVRVIAGEVEEQQGCLFRGTLDFQTWVGAIAPDHTVYSDYAGAKGVGELGARRGGVYTEMSFTYTIPAVGGGPATACTGIATRD
jgi:hypothetical protein